MALPPPTALVTGGARRVGAAICRELHASGYNVVIHYRASGADARALAAELNGQRPDSAHCLRANLLEVPALDRLAREAHEHWGRLDALVNNASSYYRTPLPEIDQEAFEDLMGTNFRAPLFLTRACVAHMSGGGAVVNVADINAEGAMPGYAPYCAAKAALLSLTRSLARELAPRIRINAVAPGHILWSAQNTLTEPERAAVLARVPLGRLGQAEEVARAVRFLLSADAGFTTGAVLPVDGGLGLL